MLNISSNGCTDNLTVPDYSTAYHIPDNVVLGLLIFILCINLIGNLIVIIVILLRQRMQTFTNWMILNLALADLSVAVYCITLELPLEIYNKWIYEEFFCTILYPIQSATIYGSVFTLLVLSCSRFWAVVFPFKLQPTTFGAKVSICVIWATSVVLVTPYMIALEFDENETHCKEMWNHKQRKIFTLLTFVFQYIIPLAIIIVAYGLIACDVIVKKRHSETRYADKRKYRENRKLTRLLFVITLVFAICVLPYHAVTIAVEFGNDGCYEYISDITIASYLLLYLNSALNPILYNLFSSQFRQGFVESYKKGKNVFRSGFSFGDNLSARVSKGSLLNRHRSETQVTYCRQSGHFIRIVVDKTVVSAKCDTQLTSVY